MKCNDFLTLESRDTLGPWPLTRWSWKFVVGLVSRGHSLCKIWSIPGWVIENSANFGPCYVTLWPWPLTPWPWTYTVDGAWCGQSVSNLTEIAPAAAELLAINDRFFVRFRGCSNTAGAVSKTHGSICTKLGENIARSRMHTTFKNGEDILLGFQTTVAQIRALVSDKAKGCTFWPPPL